MTLPLVSDPVQVSGGHTALASSGSTVALTPTATLVTGRLYLYFFGGSGTTLRTCSSVSGAGGTWTELTIGDANVNDGVNWGVSCFTSTNASGVNPTITGTFSGSWGTSRFAHLFEITAGFDTSGLIVQSRNNATTAPPSMSISTFTRPASLHNIIFGYFVHRVNEALTALNGGVLVGTQNVATPASAKALWFKRGDVAAGPPGVSWTGGARGAIGVGAEVKAAKVAAIANRHSVSGSRVLRDGVRL